MQEPENALIRNQDELWEALAVAISEHFFQQTPAEAQLFIDQWTT